jgi:hypothetical protein
MDRVTVEQWVELFRAIGLSDADMSKWHHLFEAKYPEAHQRFLEWLGMDAERIRKVRNSN